MLEDLKWLVHKKADKNIIDKGMFVKTSEGTVSVKLGTNVVIKEKDVSDSEWVDKKDEILETALPMSVSSKSIMPKTASAQDATAFILKDKVLKEKLRKAQEWGRVTKKRVMTLAQTSPTTFEEVTGIEILQDEE